ncbi:hypothetical protein HA466_0091030 [Hirschfeldia incana]|nr:hypothetical protein HA466_0091030 [Hirschfeldia incana]
MNKESVVIAGECSRFVMLLQMHSNVDELQKGFMSLFLESVLVVFSKTSDGVSQEVLELRNVAVRLVSHLAQLPSSAIHFKDVLLSLPTSHRQQLQDIIRASVSQDSSSLKPKSLVPPMDIKLPAPVVATPEKITSSAAVVKAEILSTVPTSLNQASTVETGTDEENDDEDDDDDDDDWDTFQSFPASTNLEGSGSKTESVTEEETGFPVSSSIQDNESGSKAESVTEEETGFPVSSSIQDNESGSKAESTTEEETCFPVSSKSALAEEADDQHLESDRASDSKEVEKETVYSSLNEEALLTSQNDKNSSDDHLVETKEESVESSKSSEPEIVGVNTKLPSTEADSPALDDTSDYQDPQHLEKSVQDDQVECSNEHVVSEKVVAGNKSQ